MFPAVFRWGSPICFLVVRVVGGVGVYQGADHFLVFGVAFARFLFGKRTLDLLGVTFVLSAGVRSFWGGGRKSETLVSLPMGLFGSFIFFFIFLVP